MPERSPLVFLSYRVALLGFLSCLVLVMPSCDGSGDDDDSGVDDDDSQGDDDDSQGDDDDSQGDDDDSWIDSDALLGPTAVMGLYPDADSKGVSVHTVLFADMKGKGTLEGATLTLTDPNGSAVAIDLSEVGGMRLAGEPTQALVAETTYQARAEFPSTSEIVEWNFSTGTAPPEISSPPAGMLYHLVLTDMTVVSPVHPDTSTFFRAAMPKFLLGVSAEGTTLSLVGGSITEWARYNCPQDICQPTWSAEGGVWNNPAFHQEDIPVTKLMDARDFPSLPVDVVVGPMQLDFISGVFVEGAAGDTRLSDFSFRGYLDIRDTGMGSVCAALPSILPGVVCEPCELEPEAIQCVYFWGEGGTAIPRPYLVPLDEYFVEDILTQKKCL